jgi:hypothetical protein
MKAEEMELITKRKEMSKEAWIRNVMRLYPDKTKQETEELWQKLFEHEVLNQIANSLEKEMKDE